MLNPTTKATKSFYFNLTLYLYIEATCCIICTVHPLFSFKGKVVNIGTTPLNTYVQTKTYASHF